MARLKVVIIGASYSGIPVAQNLLKAPANISSNIKVTLINPSPNWYFNIAAPRIFAKPNAFQPEQYLIPIAPAFAKYSKDQFEFVKGLVASIKYQRGKKSVIVNVDDKSITLNYDILVIASGSSTTSSQEGVGVPFKVPTTSDKTNYDVALREQIKAVQEQVANASSIIIGGAGPVGVEFAGELAEQAKLDKKSKVITLVSATPTIVPILKPSAQSAAHNMLAKAGVKIMTGKKIVSAAENKSTSENNKWTVNLEDGTQLHADLYISTAGVVPNNAFIPQAFLNADGWVDVDSNLRVKNADIADKSIFAVGDITKFPLRTAIKAGEQWPIAVANIKAYITANVAANTKGLKGNVKLDKSFSGEGPLMMLVPVGSSAGTGQMMGLRLPGFFVAMMKGKDFFVSNAKGLAGLA
jgi:NADH dehydrogenase FAD-containing subunit